MPSLSITRPRQAKSFGILCAAALLVSASTLAAQSSSLPATAPTVNTQPTPVAATSTSSTATATKPHRAEVTFADGLLNVRANDSSLNQILRSISQVTGMKIIGGVAEERVFGNYGPAEPATVLATLLGGTGSNMILRETASQGPAELILTPRTQGATPPSPYSSAPPDQDRDDDSAPARPAGPPQTIPPGQAQRPGPPSNPQPWNNVNGSASNASPTASTLPVTNSVPTDAIPAPSTTPATPGIVDAPNPPPAGSGLPNPTTGATDTSGSNAAGTTTTSTSPNGVKTPQQIYEQLQQLIKQGQSQANTQTTPNTQATPSSTNPQ